MLREKLREAYLKAYYGFVEKSAEEIRKVWGITQVLTEEVVTEKEIIDGYEK